LNPYLQYLEIGLFPVYTSAILMVRSKGKLPSPLWPELTRRHEIESLRQLANEYGVSHEAIRRAIARAKDSAADKKPSENSPF
jgi:Zn-dependent peptidase ImmA (M78 family)